MSSDVSTKKRVLVPIGDGSEEIEVTCITDTLTRFGADVTIASVKPDGDLICTMSRGVKIVADVTIEDAASQTPYDLIALPGGMPGAEHLRDSPILINLLRQQQQQQQEESEKSRFLGAICAAPAVVLKTHNLLTKGGGATCYPAPAFRDVMVNPVDDNVVVQDQLITSKGPGTALLFAIQLGELLYGKEKADEIAAQMLVTR